MSSKKQPEHISLYRKYRPEHFKDVLGQEQVVSVLSEALKGSNVTHSYLFHGSRGTGKTSVARILAREIGCLPEDLYEIDAASNRGIDDVRALRESVTSLPFRSPYKVYIIDEVHMLTKEAFNALLKTLEEPPRHTVFVLATTNVAKLPDTVVSRCQQFTFKKPTQKILKNSANAIAKKEGYTLEPSAAEIIALLGDGSFRDMLGVLQKVLHATKGETITREDVAAVTNAPRGELIDSFIESIIEKDIERGLKSLYDAKEASTDFDLFSKLVLRKVRFALLLRYAPHLKDLFKEEVSEDELTTIEEWSKNKSALNSEILEELLDAQSKIRYAHIEELPLELALIKILDS